MGTPIKRQASSPGNLISRFAGGVVKSAGSLPHAVATVTSKATQAILDPDLSRYQELGKKFQNQAKALKSQQSTSNFKTPHDVIVIGSPGKTGKAFELSAKTLLERYPGAEVIYAYGEGLRGAKAHKSVMERLEAAPIKNFIYTGHASESGLWLAPNTALGVKHLKGVKIENAVIYGCNAGDRGGFAEQLSNQNKSRVKAIEGTMQFSGTETGWANYGFTDKNGGSMDINKTPLKSDYPGEVWGVPAHPWIGDEWVEYRSSQREPSPSPGPTPRS